MDTENGRTRREFLRLAAGGAALLAGGGSGAYRLLDATAAAAAGSGTVHAYRSRPDLKPPVIEVVHAAKHTAPGYLFIAPSSGPGQRGALILDNTGEVVWFHPTVPHTAMNFRVTVYKGAPVLTWWEGKSQKGLGVGECVIVDQAYREIARFKSRNGLPVDLHELLVTSKNTALVTSYAVTTADATSVGGSSRQSVIDSAVQELEIPSGRVLFEWRSLDHVALSESHQKVGPRFDYFHVNSIDVDADGDLLVSARNTWAVYKVSRSTGEVIWRLGGKKSDFAMGKGTVFAWQHDARSHQGGKLISIFDDGAAPKVEPRSRALLISLDTKRMQATLARRYVHDSQLAKYTGNAQLLPNGDMLVGWGSEPYFTEFAPDGAVRFDARLPKGGQTYRALRFPWVGRPSEPPRLAALGGSLYASWNGATEVASWQLRTGKRAGSLSVAHTARKTGFETALAPPSGAAYAEVVALDASGKPLGTSKAIRV